MPGTHPGGAVRTLIFCLSLAFATPTFASDFVSHVHFFPIASKTDGLAGTRWTTSLQIVNPQAEDLTITARLSTEGAFQTETIEIPARATRSWSDAVGEIFGTDGNGALFLEASADGNANRPVECRAFAASMRISTTADDGGSFGQAVPSVDPVSGFLGDWIALFPGVVLHGQPGFDGFRTNAGFWNIGSEGAQLRLRILDTSGQEVWQQHVIADPHVPFVISLPRQLDLGTATLLVDSYGEWVDCAIYISVVDNLTGDAVFMTAQLMDPESAASCEPLGAGTHYRAVPARRSTDDAIERLRSGFLGDQQ